MTQDEIFEYSIMLLEAQEWASSFGFFLETQGETQTALMEWAWDFYHTTKGTQWEEGIVPDYSTAVRCYVLERIDHFLVNKTTLDQFNDLVSRLDYSEVSEAERAYFRRWLITLP